ERPDVQRAPGQALRTDRLRRLQPDVLPPVRTGLPGDAPALLRIPARIPGVERDVDGRRVDPGRRLRVAAGLSPSVAAKPAGCGPEPVAGHRPGVADRLAA